MRHSNDGSHYLALMAQNNERIARERERATNSLFGGFASFGEALEKIDKNAREKENEEFQKQRALQEERLREESFDFAREQEANRLKQQEWQNNLELKKWKERNVLNPLERERYRSLKLENDILARGYEEYFKEQQEPTMATQEAQKGNVSLDDYWGMKIKNHNLKTNRDYKAKEEVKEPQIKPTQEEVKRKSPFASYFESKFFNDLNVDAGIKTSSLTENIKKFRDIQTTQEAQKEVLKDLKKESGLFNGIGRNLSARTGNIYGMDTQEQEFATANGTMLDLIAKQIYGSQLSKYKEENINKRYGVGGYGDFTQNMGKMIKAKEFMVNSQRDIIDALRVSGAKEGQLREHIKEYEKNLRELQYLKDNVKRFNYKDFIEATR